MTFDDLAAQLGGAILVGTVRVPARYTDKRQARRIRREEGRRAAYRKMLEARWELRLLEEERQRQLGLPEGVTIG